MRTVTGCRFRTLVLFLLVTTVSFSILVHCRVAYGKNKKVTRSIEKHGVVWNYSNAAKLYFTKTEVTVSQFAECVKAGACQEKTFGTDKDNQGCNWGWNGRTDHPMNCIVLEAANAVCKWLGGRLPTLEEWQAEATNNGKRKWPWGNHPEPSCKTVILGETADGSMRCGQESSAPVCSVPQGNSKDGLCDMSGNVWEWTSSESGLKQEGNRLCGAAYIIGGSWDSDEISWLIPSEPSSYCPNSATPSVGVRCVADPDSINEISDTINSHQLPTSSSSFSVQVDSTTGIIGGTPTDVGVVMGNGVYVVIDDIEYIIPMNVAVDSGLVSEGERDDGMRIDGYEYNLRQIICKKVFLIFKLPKDNPTCKIVEEIHIVEPNETGVTNILSSFLREAGVEPPDMQSRAFLSSNTPCYDQRGATEKCTGGGNRLSVYAMEKKKIKMVDLTAAESTSSRRANRVDANNKPIEEHGRGNEFSESKSSKSNSANEAKEEMMRDDDQRSNSQMYSSSSPEKLSLPISPGILNESIFPPAPPTKKKIGLFGDSLEFGYEFKIGSVSPLHGMYLRALAIEALFGNNFSIHMALFEGSLYQNHHWKYVSENGPISSNDPFSWSLGGLSTTFRIYTFGVFKSPYKLFSNDHYFTMAFLARACPLQAAQLSGVTVTDPESGNDRTEHDVFLSHRFDAGLEFVFSPLNVPTSRNTLSLLALTMEVGYAFDYLHADPWTRNGIEERLDKHLTHNFYLRLGIGVARDAKSYKGTGPFVRAIEKVDDNLEELLQLLKLYDEGSLEADVIEKRVNRKRWQEAGMDSVYIKAIQKDPDALYQLGRFCLDVLKMKSEAYSILKIAADLGHNKALRLVKEEEGRLAVERAAIEKRKEREQRRAELQRKRQQKIDSYDPGPNCCAISPNTESIYLVPDEGYFSCIRENDGECTKSFRTDKLPAWLDPSTYSPNAPLD